MKPSIGRIVHYFPTEQERAVLGARSRLGHGNPVAEGEPIAAVIVQVFGEDTCNLRLLTDGAPWEGEWVTSRTRCDEPAPGEWMWPPRV